MGDVFDFEAARLAAQMSNNPGTENDPREVFRAEMDSVEEQVRKCKLLTNDERRQFAMNLGGILKDLKATGCNLYHVTNEAGFGDTDSSKALHDYALQKDEAHYDEKRLSRLKKKPARYLQIARVAHRLLDGDESKGIARLVKNTRFDQLQGADRLATLDREAMYHMIDLIEDASRYIAQTTSLGEALPLAVRKGWDEAPSINEITYNDAKHKYVGPRLNFGWLGAVNTRRPAIVQDQEGNDVPGDHHYYLGMEVGLQLAFLDEKVTPTLIRDIHQLVHLHLEDESWPEVRIGWPEVVRANGQELKGSGHHEDSGVTPIPLLFLNGGLTARPVWADTEEHYRHIGLFDNNSEFHKQHGVYVQRRQSRLLSPAAFQEFFVTSATYGEVCVLESPNQWLSLMGNFQDFVSVSENVKALEVAFRDQRRAVLPDGEVIENWNLFDELRLSAENWAKDLLAAEAVSLQKARNHFRELRRKISDNADTQFEQD